MPEQAIRSKQREDVPPDSLQFVIDQIEIFRNFLESIETPPIEK